MAICKCTSSRSFHPARNFIVNGIEIDDRTFCNNSPTNGGFFGDASAGVTGSTRGAHFAELNAAYDVAEGWNLSGQIGRQYIPNTTGLNISYYKVGLTRALPDGWSAGAFFSATSEPKAYDSYYSLSNGTSKHDIAKEKFFVSISKAF